MLGNDGEIKLRTRFENGTEERGRKLKETDGNGKEIERFKWL